MGDLKKRWDEYRGTIPHDFPNELCDKFEEIFYLGATVAQNELDRAMNALTIEEKNAITQALTKDIKDYVLNKILPRLKSDCET